METKDESTQQQTSDLENFEKRYPHFSSQEAMRAYYTQMYRLFNPGGQPFDDMEIVRLKELRKRLKKYLQLVQELSEHEWGQGVIEMQTACSAFMMRESITVGKRMLVNDQISGLMAFLFRMAESRGLMKNLYGMMNDDFKNVCALISEYEKKHFPAA